MLLKRPDTQHGMKRWVATVAAAAALSYALYERDALAVPMDVTAGSIHMDSTTPAPFDDVTISLQGSAFSLTNSFLIDSFHFMGSPNPGLVLLHAGDSVRFTGEAALVAPSDVLLFNGVPYRASGRIDVQTDQAIVDSSMTQPFTLTGQVHGERLGAAGSVDLELAGSGMVIAQFQQLPNGLLELRAIQYNLVTAPEPSTWVLLVSGLVVIGFTYRSFFCSVGNE